MLKKKNKSGDSMEETNGYDSMIENGTSEDENDESDKTPPKKANLKRKSETKDGQVTMKTKTNAKKSKSEKVKPPTLEEINELKETRNLFHSNLFRLQVKEMLTELKVKEKYVNYAHNWLEKFKDFVKSLPSSTEKEDANNISWLSTSTIKLPLAINHLRNEQRKFQFQFIKPTMEPYFIGATASETLLGPKLVLDVCVPMPASSFQKENYLNLVFDQKRTLYLVFLANEMLKSQWDDITESEMFFNYYGNNPFKAVLEIVPKAKINAKQKLCIRIFVAAEKDSFKLSRFVPWNNNIRCKIFEGVSDEDEETVKAPTPAYNANALFDLTMHSNTQLMVNIFKGNKNLQEALVLLKVWLQQRHLNIGFVGFSTHLLAMFICYLHREHKLHKNMSSYQVARTFWNQLAHSSWDVAGQSPSLCTEIEAESTATNKPTSAQFHEYYDVVFVDVTGYYNMCSNVSKEVYHRVRFESKLAVDMLNNMKLNSFQTLFMTKYPIYGQFDQILKISKPDSVEQLLEMHVPLDVKQNFAGFVFPQLLKVVTSLLKKGLDKRLQAIIPMENPISHWSCTTPPEEGARYLQLGLVLDPAHAYEILDKGPESIDNAAEEFRRFWGDKAKLRRFQDGSITESVVWASVDDTLAQKRLVCRSIVLHLLQHHFQLESQDIVYIAGEMDVVYKLTPAFKTEHMHEKFKVPQESDAEVLCLRLIRAFDELTRQLQSLKDLPLEIVSIVGTSPAFRYCEPTPVLPLARIIGEDMYATNVQRGVIQLALSGKWPNELEALRAMKIAFYIQIAELLRERCHLAVKVTYDGILVLKQAYSYQIEIAHPKELSLLKQAKTERGITQYVDSPASIELEKRHYVLPKVTGALHALHHQYPSFGGTVMIAKRWLYAQMIDYGLWPDECTELLVASLYLQAVNEQQITCSPQTGFVRFLQLIAHTDWKTELFVLNFNNSFDENQLTELEQKFNTKRDQFPPLCVATPYDRGHYGKLWSSSTTPNINVLARVTLLARQALEMIEKCILDPFEAFIRPSKLFVPSTQGYDLVIQLKPEEVPNTTAFDFGSSFTALTKPNWRLPLAGTNYMDMAVTKLREAYGEFAAFFYNPCGGGKVIGVVWKPNVFNEKEFKIQEVQGCQLTSGWKLRCSRETFIEDFKFILKDYCLRIDSVENVLNASKETAAVAALNRPYPKKRYFEKIKSEGNDEESNITIANVVKGKKGKSNFKGTKAKTNSINVNKNKKKQK